MQRRMRGCLKADSGKPGQRLKIAFHVVKIHRSFDGSPLLWKGRTGCYRPEHGHLKVARPRMREAAPDLEQPHSLLLPGQIELQAIDEARNQARAHDAE